MIDWQPQNPHIVIQRVISKSVKIVDKTAMLQRDPEIVGGVDVIIEPGGELYIL